jgi:hypothetical protein
MESTAPGSSGGVDFQYLSPWEVAPIKGPQVRGQHLELVMKSGLGREGKLHDLKQNRTVKRN